MKNAKWIWPVTGAIVGAGITYALLPKRTIPKGAIAFSPFDMDKYAGSWNEIARLPTRIEKNVAQLVETYISNGDGTYKVDTRAFNAEKQKWSEMTGTLKVAEEGTGHLKVSYFGPIWFNYNVLDIDDDYQYALASGSSTDYLWILSRETNIPKKIRERFLKKAEEFGFDITQLIWNKLE